MACVISHSIDLITRASCQLLFGRKLHDRPKAEGNLRCRMAAIIAVFISIIVGLVQIYGTQDVDVSNFPQLQTVEISNENLKIEVTNFPKIQPVWVNNPTQ